MLVLIELGRLYKNMLNFHQKLEFIAYFGVKVKLSKQTWCLQITNSLKTHLKYFILGFIALQFLCA